MLPENIYLSFGPGTREAQEKIAAEALELLEARLISQELALRGAVAQAYLAGYNLKALLSAPGGGPVVIAPKLPTDRPEWLAR